VINRAKQEVLARNIIGFFLHPKGTASLRLLAMRSFQGKLEAAQHVLSFALYDDAIFLGNFNITNV
jgi:hypothetical protein